MLRIIVFCAVKIANREKETETRKGDRIDDQTRKFNLSEASSPYDAMGDYSVLIENEKNIKTERNAKKSDRDIRRKIK